MYKKNKESSSFGGIVPRAPKYISMKLSILLLFVGTLQVSAITYGQTISLTKTQVPLKQVLREIQKQAGVNIFYDEALIAPDLKVTIAVKNQTLEATLKQLLQAHGLAYTFMDNNIILREHAQAKSLFPASASRRQRILKGKVLDASGKGIANVTISVKGSGIKTETDHAGAFSVAVDGLDEVLFFTSLGYERQEVTVGDRQEMVVYLQATAIEVDEVVVTALGIKREEKSLGYAAQTVSAKSVTDAKTNNWTSSLTGKVAGLTVQGAGAGPMGSTRITLRGESSLNLDNNQALIVIDGVPISNRITGTGFNSYLAQDSPVDFGTNVSDLNPDDIASVTVLKGPAATALYGSRAASGALVITTKTGIKNTGVGITVNSNFNMEQINRWPDFQYAYGEGRTSAYYSYGASEDGPNTSTTVGAGRAWGPKFDGQSYFQYDPNTPSRQSATRMPWLPNDDYISGYFQTGFTHSNSIAIDGGNERGGSRVSLTHLSNKWIIPNTGFKRTNMNFSTNQEISKRLKVNGRVNYAYKQSDNLPAAGYNNQTLMYFLMLGAAPNIIPEWFKPYWVEGQEGIEQSKPFNSGPDNPYLMMYEMLNSMDKHNFIGNVSANYKFSDQWELMVRSGLDFSSEKRAQQRPYSMTKYPYGMYREQQVLNSENNTDVLLTYTGNVNADLQYTLSGGGNYMVQSFDFKGMNADRLAQPNIYQLANSMDPVVAEADKYKKAIASVYAFWRTSYKDQLFLDVTGRNDWSSTLPSSARSFFYPSVNLAWSVLDTWHMPAAFSFAKLRLSWAQVGNDTNPYQTARYYNQIYGNSLTNASVLFNPDLKPEITSSLEAGLDVRFFGNRLGLDLTVYNNNSRNQILATPIDPVTGYRSALINAGLINSRGVEAVLTTKPIVRDRFRWTSTVNWSLNRSYVRELADGIASQIIYNNADLLTIEARVGGRMGDMYGLGFRRSPDGAILYNDQGLPESLDPTLKKWGNAFPDWKGGWLNQFEYQNIALSILLDAQQGGSIYSHTNHKFNTLGKTNVTLPGRDEGIIGQGVVQQADGSFLPNEVRVAASTYYENFYQLANVETNIFDASFLKIREVRLAYALPKSAIKRLHLEGLTVALWARDLFNFTKFPGFDPETGNLNSGTLTPGVEIAQFPSPRTMGANLTFKF